MVFYSLVILSVAKYLKMSIKTEIFRAYALNKTKENNTTKEKKMTKNSNPTDLIVIVSERSERGTSPQLRSSDLARKRECAQLRKQNPHYNRDKIDCHEFASANSRNDKKTHPQTPSAREGVLRKVATLSSKSSLRDFRRKLWQSTIQNNNNGLPRATSNARNDGNICHTERSEVSLKNIDCHEFASANSRNDGIISPSIAEDFASYPHSIADLQTSCPPSLSTRGLGGGFLWIPPPTL